jgi:hypothetical protein
MIVETQWFEPVEEAPGQRSSTTSGNEGDAQ